jgi:hypothetical protein
LARPRPGGKTIAEKKDSQPLRRGNGSDPHIGAHCPFCHIVHTEMFLAYVSAQRDQGIEVPSTAGSTGCSRLTFVARH